MCDRCGCQHTVATDSRTGERTCPICGRLSYDALPERPERVMFARARYGGDALAFADTVIRVEYRKVERRGGLGLTIRVVTVPMCPFCGAEMRQTGVSGKARGRGEERFACPDRHSIGIAQARTGRLNWR